MRKFLALIILAMPLAAFSASFDCNKAASLSEMLICNDADLSRLDDELSIIYKQAKATASDQATFKQQTKAAWQWREKNCQSKECLISWFANRKTTLQKLTAASASSSVASYKYEPTVVTLIGKLVSADGQTPDEEPLKFPAILLDRAITVQGDQETPTEIGVILLHLAMNDSTMSKYRKYKGRSVTITGTLFHSDNGNHQTNVLVSPIDIKPSSE